MRYLQLGTCTILLATLVSYPSVAQIRASHWAIAANVTHSYYYRAIEYLGGYASITAFEPSLHFRVNERLQIGYGYGSSISSYTAFSSTQSTGTLPEEEANVGAMTAHSFIASWKIDGKDRKIIHHLMFRISQLQYTQSGASPDTFSGQQIVAGIAFDKTLGKRLHWRILEIGPGILITDNKKFVPFSLYLGMGMSAQLRFQPK